MNKAASRLMSKSTGLIHPVFSVHTIDVMHVLTLSAGVYRFDEGCME